MADCLPDSPGEEEAMKRLPPEWYICVLLAMLNVFMNADPGPYIAAALMIAAIFNKWGKEA